MSSTYITIWFWLHNLIEAIELKIINDVIVEFDDIVVDDGVVLVNLISYYIHELP